MDEQQYQERAAQLRKPTGDQGIAIAEFMNKGNRQMNLDALTILNAAEGDTILEVGMGNGLFVKEIVAKHPSIQYTGIDFSELMIAESKKINEEWIRKEQASFVFSDVTALPFDDGAFNKIFTVNTIYFWDDTIKVLNELKRVLSSNGKLIISLRPKHQAIKYPFTKYGFTLYAKEDIAGLLSTNGFTNIEVFVNKEPDMNVNGETFNMENLIVSGVKK
ncbi:class I SAM-dependent methyltransferase [Ferruginibacter sp. SUN002]|uniref:class I SAM-dependent methyltransferase n=1 Tax=Ferruginibacter sp. SUN002 TaxID=2937789 RepID=UPI003D36A1B7